VVSEGVSVFLWVYWNDCLKKHAALKGSVCRGGDDGNNDEDVVVNVSCKLPLGCSAEEDELKLVVVVRSASSIA
jgi:hypothetical protein